MNPDTSAVVGRVHDVVLDVEVVVDGFVVGGLEESGVLGVAEVREIGDVGDWDAVCGASDAARLVELVVEEDVLVPVALGPPTLVSVLQTMLDEGPYALME